MTNVLQYKRATGYRMTARDPRTGTVTIRRVNGLQSVNRLTSFYKKINHTIIVEIV